MVHKLRRRDRFYLEWNQPDTTQYFAANDDVLEYMVGDDRLRDVITQVTVLDHTI